MQIENKTAFLKGSKTPANKERKISEGGKSRKKKTATGQPNWCSV